MLITYRGVAPKLGKRVYLVDSAQVIGDVEIGDDSSVWFNAVIRGDVNYIRIGSATNVQDNSTLHVTKDVYPLFVGSQVTIGHNVTLHGCKVADRCLIGMGAIILDNAQIGEDSIVGAGALVTEGSKFPPASLILGMPAKVARPLKKEEIDRIIKSSANYIDYAKQYTGEK